VALETFNYLDSLVPANPTVSDGVVNGDDHIRGMKLALKNTFPNISGAITATQADLSAVAGGASVLNDAGALFKTSGDGFKNTLAGDIDVFIGGTTGATFQRTGGANFFKVYGNIQTVGGGSITTNGLTSTAEIKGPGITPIGATVMWWDDTLPSDGLWAWANGQIITNANIVCPVLLARWGNRFGGNGTTTMGLPNLCEVVPVGRSQMGGSSPQGLLSSISDGAKAVLNGLFGVDTVTLSTTQIPAHSHPNSLSDPGHSHSGVIVGANTYSSPGGATVVVQSVTFGTSSAVGTGITISNANAGGGGSHTNVQPSRAVCWIVRIG
jgi:microcystin-dependent protein